MPFRTTFLIYDYGHQAPTFQTDDKRFAQINYENRMRKWSNGQGFPSLREKVQLVEPATQAERYLFLVYNVRRLQRDYICNGRTKDKLVLALQAEKQLDEWNNRIREKMKLRPDVEIKDKLAYAFFEAVEEWRTLWREMMGYRKSGKGDQSLIKDLSKMCRVHEKTIDEYIRRKINLLT